MGDNEKTIRSSVSAATLLKVNILIYTFDANYICKFGDFSNKNVMFEQILNNEHNKKQT